MSGPAGRTRTPGPQAPLADPGGLGHLESKHPKPDPGGLGHFDPGHPKPDPRGLRHPDPGHPPPDSGGLRHLDPGHPLADPGEFGHLEPKHPKPDPGGLEHLDPGHPPTLTLGDSDTWTLGTPQPWPWRTRTPGLRAPLAWPLTLKPRGHWQGSRHKWTPRTRGPEGRWLCWVGSPRLRRFPLVSNDYLMRGTGQDMCRTLKKPIHPQGTLALQKTSSAVMSGHLWRL